MSLLHASSPEAARRRAAFLERARAIGGVFEWRFHEAKDGFGVPAYDDLNEWEAVLLKHPILPSERWHARRQYARALSLIARWRAERASLEAAANDWLNAPIVEGGSLRWPNTQTTMRSLLGSISGASACAACRFVTFRKMLL